MIQSRKGIRGAAVLAAVALTCFAAAKLSAQSGFIAGEIQIQGLLYPSSGGVDWVAGTTGSPNFAATAGVNCAKAVGQVSGARIADHVGGSGRDPSMFLTGGKLEDVSTWNVGDGSLGANKYNCTQAYLANNRKNIFFAMERQSNDGTTAFDFEFNKSGSVGSTKPVRQVGDVLFTFEVRGSGNSGSVTPFVFVWDGAHFVNKSAASAKGVTNNASIKPAPWGYVDSKNNWSVTGGIPNFQFAEAVLSLADAFGSSFDPCNAIAFVQIRTRSSATVNSDLKDATPIFQYEFGSPTPRPNLTPNVCLPQFGFNGSASTDSDGKTVAQGANLNFDWEFSVNPTNAILSGTGVSGGSGLYTSKSMNGLVDVTLPTGVNKATITATLTISDGLICRETAAPITVEVNRAIVATIKSKVANGTNMSVALTASAPGADRLQWQRWNAATSTWVNYGSAIDVSAIASGTGTLVYSSFETDATPVVKSFNIDGIVHQGKCWVVKLRVRGYRLDADGNEICGAASESVTLQKVIAVDP